MAECNGGTILRGDHKVEVKNIYPDSDHSFYCPLFMMSGRNIICYENRCPLYRENEQCAYRCGYAASILQQLEVNK
jgi:hypothetical protein